MKKVLFTTLLAFLMFVPSLCAEEEFGKFEAITPDNVTITPTEANTKDVTYVVNEANLEWVTKDETIGRNVDGWWIGFKVTAPTAGYEKAKATYTYTFYDGRTKTNSYEQGLDKPSETEMSAWFLVKEEDLEALKAKSEETPEMIRYEFDWNGDDTVDQTFIVKLNVEKIKLDEVSEGYHTLTFESEKGTKSFTVKDGETIDKYFSNTEKEILESFLEAPEGKELDRMYVVSKDEEEKEFSLEDAISEDLVVKVLYKDVVVEENSENPNTGDNIVLYGFIGLISLGLLLALRKAN